MDDGAVRALLAPRAALEPTIGELSGAAERATLSIDLRRRRHSGFAIVSTEHALLIVESSPARWKTSVSWAAQVPPGGGAGAAARGVTITGIGRLFRISRQRASALANEITKRPSNHEDPHRPEG